MFSTAETLSVVGNSPTDAVFMFLDWDVMVDGWDERKHRALGGFCRQVQQERLL